MAPPETSKKVLGRQKIDIKPIESLSARGITFSKRRAGLFKKATELATLCGVQIALLVFSMSGKAFTFGHPSVESVLNRFRSGRRYMPYMEDNVQSSRFSQASAGELKGKWDKLSKEVEVAKKRRKELYVKLESAPGELSEENLSQLDLMGLMELKDKLKKLHDQLKLKAKKEHVSPNDLQKKINLANVEINEDEKFGWLKL